MNKACKNAVFGIFAAFMLTLTAFTVFLPSDTAISRAETEDGIYAYFYSDDGLYATVDADGIWIVPAEKPEKDGYIFRGWSDNGEGFQRILNPESEQAALSKSQSFYAVWEAEPPVIAPPPDEPLFNDTEKILILTAVGVLVIIIFFVFYHRVAKRK